MSVSRFRHSTGNVAKPQHQFLNVTSSTAMWDGSNTIACNEKFVAVPWQTFGGAAVFAHQSYGKVVPNPPIVLGQEGPIIDLKFDPFDQQKLYTASEDGSIFGWNIPSDGLESNCSTAAVQLRGHNKKCGVLSFHPSAKGVLGSAALDRVVNIWDVERGAAVTTINTFADYVTDFEWNQNGSMFCVSSRDKRLSIVDPRGAEVVSSVEAHTGARLQRCVWAKRKNCIMTLGWNDNQQRQIKLWDTRTMASAYNTVTLDQSSAAFMPLYDEDTNLLFLGGKGESTVKAFELMEEGLTFSFEMATVDPMKGLCMMPKWCLDVKRCEYDQLYQLTYTSLLTLDVVLPRKQAAVEFQADVFPSTFADQPGCTAEQFFDGEDAAPREYKLDELFHGRRPQVCIVKRQVMKVAPENVAAEVPGHSPPAVVGGSVSTHLEVSESPDIQPDSREEGNAGSTSSSKHVDPCGDMTPQEVVRKERKMKELAAKLHTYHQEIAALRKALQEREVEMLRVLEDFERL